MSPMPTSSLQRYRWEAIHAAAICAVIAIFYALPLASGSNISA